MSEDSWRTAVQEVSASFSNSFGRALCILGPRGPLRDPSIRHIATEMRKVRATHVRKQCTK